MRIVFSALLLLPLAACSPSDTDPGPGGVTVGEARALDEAAEIIEQRRLPPEALEPQAGGDAPVPNAGSNAGPNAGPNAGDAPSAQ